MPPFGRLAAIIVSSENQAEANEVARMIGRAAPAQDNMAVFGPAPAPLAMLRGRHRFRLLVHATSRRAGAGHHPRLARRPRAANASARVAVDVAPDSFL